MGRLDTSERLELLRRANARLRQFFERFSGAPVLGTDEEVEALLQVERSLQSIGALLGEGRLQKSDDSETREEVFRYRANLVRLRDELATMQQSAAGCRARLDSRQKHLHAAQAWCAASRTAG